MNFINHFGVWLLLVAIGYFVEFTREHPFNNAYCGYWYVPMTAMSIVFFGFEFIVLIYYMIFVW